MLRLPRPGPLGRLLGPGTYVGRILPEEEFLPFGERILAAARGELTDQETVQLTTEYLEAIGIPPEVVLALPPEQVEGVWRYLFTCQGFVPTMARAQAAKRG